MTRRVLEIVGSLAPDIDSRQLLLLANHLDPAEFDIHIVALEPGPLSANLDKLGIAHTEVAGDTRFRRGTWWRLRQSIARLQRDIVHVWPSAGAAGRAAAMLAGRGRLVMTSRAPSASQPWYAPLAVRHLAARTSALVVDCPAVAACWSQQGWPPEKIHTIAPGIAPAHSCACPRERLLAELDLPAGSRLIVVAAPLVLRERVKDLIWATDLLKVIRDDAHLLIVGHGPHRERLERYTRLCQMRDRVHFLGDTQPLSRLLAHADLFWCAGSQPGLAGGVLVAMAAGVPVVAADAPGLNALVIHEQTGFVVPIGDRAGLARYAHKILDDSALSRRLGAAAGERINTHFAPQTMVDGYAAVYREVSR